MNTPPPMPNMPEAIPDTSPIIKSKAVEDRFIHIPPYDHCSLVEIIYPASGGNNLSLTFWNDYACTSSEAVL
jgi:hypothetical protein